jgi:lysyl-tRNA synthetase class II
LQLFDAATAVDSNAVELEEELLLALEYGMPPTASLKMRLDRVLVILNENEQMLNSPRFPA